ncbi:MAG: methylated-DNA--[protein]-cysteine S-methyltransferase [Kiloniellales bacterium]|nr:methylated-DNA--[protein]-cysteine S-methyltransferase [Kiloniellales bacterium]
MFYSHWDSPVGRLLLAGDEAGLRLIGFPSGKGSRKAEPDWQRDDTRFADVVRQLEAYFAGDLKRFDLELAPRGTAFQLSVWRALQEIPYGATTSYGALAKTLGRPKASRAVGTANGSNPLPIVVPCHRVIGSSGKLTGFGGGIEVKAALLDLEKGERRLC